MARPQSQQTRDKLLALLPKGAQRIKVKDEKGRIKYRELTDLLDNDVIQVNKDGTPVVMRTKPGRKLNDGIVKLQPASDIVAELIRQKTIQIDDDPILAIAKKDPESPDLLQQTMIAIAHEAASIGFERQEAERLGVETSNISTRRINALKTVVDTWLKRKEQLSGKTVDLKSPAVQAIFKYLFEIFRDSMEKSGVVNEVIETVFSQVATIIDDERWENEMKNRMKNAG